MDEKQSVSDLLDVIIGESSQAFHSYDYKEVNEFEELLSLGELVDRLTIVNIKLYKHGILNFIIEVMLFNSFILRFS